ncbi:MAG: hypothetical protein MUP11_06015, partial [Anaerolineales bacterium]|nr:hypothetical protein [Anaerolineales bacterium]
MINTAGFYFKQGTKAMSTYDRDDPEIIKKLDEFILDEDFDSFLELFRSLHAADQAKMFNQ